MRIECRDRESLAYAVEVTGLENKKEMRNLSCAGRKMSGRKCNPER